MRSRLRIADLKHGTKNASRVMNVSVPSHIAEAVDELAQKLGASKAAVVLALLNEGLDLVKKRRGK